MKRLALLPLFICALTLRADEAKPQLVAPGKSVAAPDLKESLSADWTVREGNWEVKDGEFIVAEIPAQKHAAVIWHHAGMQSAVIDCEFKFDGAKGFLIGCDGPNKHVGRLVINSKSAKISEDSTEVKGVHPGETLGEIKLNLDPGQWHTVHFEWAGSKMAARIDGQELKGESPKLEVKKVRWWFAVSGATARIRNIKAFEGKSE